MNDSKLDRQRASSLFDAIGEQLGVDVFVLKYGPNAEGGWRVEAYNTRSGEQWITECESILIAANELARLVRFKLDVG